MVKDLHLQGIDAGQRRLKGGMCHGIAVYHSSLDPETQSMYSVRDAFLELPMNPGYDHTTYIGQDIKVSH